MDVLCDVWAVELCPVCLCVCESSTQTTVRSPSRNILCDVLINRRLFLPQRKEIF